jgi:hypothetical protein
MNTELVKLLKTAVYGWVVLVIPAYDQGHYTPLEHEDMLRRLREPYQQLVKEGYLSFGGRHANRERYRVTKKGEDMLAWSAKDKV